MAKSDSFFIRATVNMPTGTNAFVQEEIDLGSFVNLGVSKSTLLRIRNVQVQITDTSAIMSGPYKTGSVFNLGYQLTTQDQTGTGLVSLADKSVIASGRYSVMVGASDEFFEADVKDNLPQDFTNGYLCGVDSIYLGMAADQTSTGESYDLAICIEAQLENATQANSVALALSQQ